MKLEKKQVIDRILAKLRAELEATQAAAVAAHEAATHEQSKAEDQYDTRGLEASYLAGAQAVRVSELEKQIAYFRLFELRELPPGAPISPGALVQTECEGKEYFCFLAGQGGGISVQVGAATVQVVTPSSNLGDALIGKKSGDVIQVESPRGEREYEILAVT